MRNEAKAIYEDLESGLGMSEIEGNPKTKAKIHRAFLYRKLIDLLIDDLMKADYTFSTYDLQKLLNKKKDGR